MSEHQIIAAWGIFGVISLLILLFENDAFVVKRYPKTRKRR